LPAAASCVNAVWRRSCQGRNGFSIRELATDERLPNRQAPLEHGDVLPAKRQQLAAAKRRPECDDDEPADEPPPLGERLLGRDPEHAVKAGHTPR
jgi:hypothetical protein